MSEVAMVVVVVGHVSRVTRDVCCQVAKGEGALAAGGKGLAVLVVRGRGQHWQYKGGVVGL